MLSRLVLVFVLVPLAELALLVWIGERVGLLPTVALVVATGILGAWLARRQGLATWGRFRAASAAGRIPGRELLEGVLVLVAGAVLLTPGILTDVAGFLLLTPPVRRRLVRAIEARVRIRMTAAVGRAGARTGRPRPATGDEEVIDAEYEVLDPPSIDVGGSGPGRGGAL